MIEIWKDVINWESYYQVSNLGRCKSLDRVISYKDGRSRFFKGIILAGYINSSGYLYVTLNISGQKDRFFIHRLVLSTFKPTKNFKAIVNHIDNNKLNNSLDNLEWCDHSYNQIHAMKTGTFKPHTTKISYEIADLIRLEYSKGNITQKSLGDKYNLARSNINKIIQGKNWK